MKKLNQFVLFVGLLLVSCTHTSSKGTQGRSLAELDKLEPVQLVPLKPRTPAADLDWWAATEEQVRTVKCRIELPKTSTTIRGYYSNFKNVEDDGGVYIVKGARFTKELPALVLAFAKLVTPIDSTTKPELQASDDLPKQFTIPKSCEKVLCAAEAVFGKEVGPQMVFLMERFDVNTSPYSNSNASLMRSDEIQDVIRTFELVHPDQVPFGSNKKLTKFKRGYTLASYDGDGEVLANASIQLFDGWSEQSSLMRQYTLYHEFAHNHSDNVFSSYDESKTWLGLGNWEKMSESEFRSLRTSSMKGHSYVSKYGEVNPWEDFAESLSAYRFNPRLLTSTSLSKYNFIKEMVHDGISYESIESCKKPLQLTKLQSQIDQNQITFESNERNEVATKCRQSFYQSVLGNYPVGSYRQCVDFQASLILERKKNTRYQDLISQGILDRNLGTSRLQFKKLRDEISADLSKDAADWIIKSISIYGSDFKADMSTEEYCSVWQKLANFVYPLQENGKFIESDWQKYSVMSNNEYKARGGAALGICLDLASGYRPKAQSTARSIKDWFRRATLQSPKDVFAERGITRETLIQYINNRVR